MHSKLVVLGGGPGGYAAAFLAADLGIETTIVEADSRLGGTCLLRGCIPSKALLHVAKVVSEARELTHDWGVQLDRAGVNVDVLRARKEKVIGNLTGGLKQLAKQRKITVVHGLGRFTGPNQMAVAGSDGGVQTLSFDHCIIAAGSQAVRLPFMPDDPRVVDSTGALALKEVPKRMLILGGGIIGLEMGTVYSTLGARLDVVEMLDGLMQGADRDLVKMASAGTS